MKKLSTTRTRFQHTKDEGHREVVDIGQFFTTRTRRDSLALDVLVRTECAKPRDQKDNRLVASVAENQGAHVQKRTCVETEH